MDINNEELTNRVYDTLAGNVGMSEHHIALNPESIVMGECNAKDGKIVFNIGEKNFEIKITQIESDYFSKE